MKKKFSNFNDANIAWYVRGEYAQSFPTVTVKITEIYKFFRKYKNCPTEVFPICLWYNKYLICVLAATVINLEKMSLRMWFTFHHI